MMKLFILSMMVTMTSQKNHMMVLTMIMLICTGISIMMFLLSMNQWVSLLLILIYISGVMVLFMYIISLAPNEKNKVKKNALMLVLMLMVLLSNMGNKMNQETLMNSSYKSSLTMVFMMVSLIAMASYITPKMMMNMFKGMKSSK